MSSHQYNRQGWSRSGRSRHRALLNRLGLGSLTKKISCSSRSPPSLRSLCWVLRSLPSLLATCQTPNSLTQRSISQTTKIYDRTGEHVLYEIFGEENRTLVRLQEGFCGDGAELDLDENGIPLFAAQATIAAEDHSFCEHSGFDVKGLPAPCSKT